MQGGIYKKDWESLHELARHKVLRPTARSHCLAHKGNKYQAAKTASQSNGTMMVLLLSLLLLLLLQSDLEHAVAEGVLTLTTSPGGGGEEKTSRRGGSRFGAQFGAQFGAHHHQHPHPPAQYHLVALARVTCPVPGQACAAQFAFDQHWYRAARHGAHHTVEVRFVDYGR
jgi:hypothetical protein